MKIIVQEMYEDLLANEMNMKINKEYCDDALNDIVDMITSFEEEFRDHVLVKPDWYTLAD
mgnify:CR=1 FL=1